MKTRIKKKTNEYGFERYIPQVKGGFWSAWKNITSYDFLKPPLGEKEREKATVITRIWSVGKGERSYDKYEQALHYINEYLEDNKKVKETVDYINP